MPTMLTDSIEAALAHSARFLATCQSPKTVIVERLSQARLACVYAEVAVHLAAAERDATGAEGPTDLQVSASKAADAATNMFYATSVDCLNLARKGAPNF